MRLTLPLFLLAAGISAAATITFGTPNTQEGCTGAACVGLTALGTLDYQQVFSADDFVDRFHGPVEINQIMLDGTVHLRTASITIWLSTTSRAVGNLDTNLAANPGADQQVFATRSGPFNSLTFDGTSFLYDPSAGNLLMNVHVTNLNPGNNPSLLVLEDSLAGQMSRVVSAGANIYRDETGVVTTFDVEPLEQPTEPMPEPASFGLLGGGLMIACLVRSRFRGSR